MSDEGIDMVGALSSSQLKWKAPRSISVKPDGVLLMMTNLTGVWLPDAALAEGTADDVRQLVTARRDRIDPTERQLNENPLVMNLSCPWTTSDILTARDRYLENSAEMQRERAAFKSGKKIAAGHAEPENLGAIIDWKSPRPKRRIMTCNSADEITEALRVAVSAKHGRTAVGVLYGLNGVDVAMASAILTAIDPEMYTVIDWRALNALGVKKSWLTVDDYLRYLGFCKTKAGELGIRLRDLDQALWVLGGT